MVKAWRGPLLTLVILGGIVVFLFFNQEVPKTIEAPADPVATTDQGEKLTPGPKPTGRVQEHPIGEEVVKNHVQVAAVWLASVGMDGRPISEGKSLIHLEADVRATAGNPNGFAKNEFVPYLKVRYKLFKAGSNQAIESGEMLPMVAFDGLHYGANVESPEPGAYQLVFEIDPPSAGGLGRHSDPLTGVAPWWDSFTAAFEWTVEPSTANTTARNP